jgi:hypothetical protein
VKSFSDQQLDNPELLMLLRVLLLRQMATGAVMQIDGEPLDPETIQRVINRSPDSRLALICDHLLCVVPEADRPKYGEVFARLLCPSNRAGCGEQVHQALAPPPALANSGVGARMLKFVQYQRGLADRVFDVFGSKGFNVSEDGRLWWFGASERWCASPGDWIYLDAAGNPAVSQDRPSSDPSYDEALVRARIEVLTDEAVATSAIEGIHLNREVVRQAVMRRLALLASEDTDVRRIAFERVDEDNFPIDPEDL